jgi:beta-glucanase (GH16 family)
VARPTTEPGAPTRRWPARLALALVVLAGCGGAAQPATDPAVAAGTWRISTSSRPVYDALGHVWRADAFATGGRRERPAIAPRHTASPQLYRTRRAGVPGYSIPVGRSGTYAVVIYLAEDGDVPVGSALFDVLAEGRRVGTVVGRTTNAGLPNHVVFTAPVRDGRLDLRFAARRSAPQVSAIKVTRMSRSAAPAATRWRDEFAGPAGRSVDRRRWAFDLGVGGTPGWGNDELQTYTSRRENIALDGAGHLAITARREQHADADGVTRSYTSARIQTHGRYAFTYGAVAARLKMPAGGGIWPSFWAVGDNVYRVGWPKAGEIDVVEILHSDPMLAWGSLHGPAPGGGPFAVSREVALAQPATAGFHVYAMLWVPGAIQMRFDGRPYATYTPEDLGRARTWVFDHPFHLILNVAVGGRTAGALTEATPFPTTMLVDWVRVAR